MSRTIDKLTLHPFLDGVPKQMLIGGAWTPSVSAQTHPSVNPSTGRAIADIAEGGAEDVDLAVAAARQAFEGPWSRYTPAQRENKLLELADLLDERFEALRLLDVIDMGSPVGGSLRANAHKPVELARYYAGWPTKIHGDTIPSSQEGSALSFTLREPVGVVAAIIPWNGPFQSALMKIAPALAAGCTVVLKPSEESALSVLLLGELIQELDLPPGVVNIVTGAGSVAGAALAGHRDVDKIAFTGSTATGQAIVRASAGNLKRVSLELGGKSPDVIFADADLDVAVPAASMAVFGGAGQTCIAGARVYVERAIHDEFVDRMATFADGLKVGDSLDPTTQIGPVISRRQLDRVSSYIDGARMQGAVTAAGGERLTGDVYGDGFFVGPTVLTDVRDDMQVVQDEIFGPVAAVMPFDDLAEVAQRANATQYGLAGAVWTENVDNALRMASAMHAGMVWVNCYGLFDPAVPFGGLKMSGWGNELGMQSMDEYLNVKSVWIAAPG